MPKMNPVVRGILSGVAIFAIVIVIQYLKSVIWKEAFTPDWVSAVFLALVGGVATVFGPDAAQRKKNREALAKKLVKK